MTIKHIQARFTSGNEIPIDKAVVPADEWRMAMAEIQVLKDMLIWNRLEIDADERNLCQLTDDLAESRMEVERLRFANRDLSDWFEAAKADARRYQWLQQGNRLTVKCKSATVIFGPNTERDYPEQLDAAIDAAMQADSIDANTIVSGFPITSGEWLTEEQLQDLTSKVAEAK